MSHGSWLVALLLVAVGCGAPQEPAAEKPRVTATPSESAPADRSPTEEPGRASRPRTAGTVVTVGESPFGRMLFDDRQQAIYLFEPEADGTPACYGACEEAWPPVLTEGPPVGRGGAEADMLGTVRRRDGSRQVTYNGWPLYFYAHEKPGEVLCHDVVLNGGLWLALGPDGRALPA